MAPKSRLQAADPDDSEISRILVGVRIEPRLVKVMKALSELHDCALGELIEKIFWVSMDGGNGFGERGGPMTPETKRQIQSLKRVYGVTYGLDDLMRPKVRRSRSSASDV